jgi:hypothetical protein
MTTRDDRFIGLLEDYLDEFDGATPLPDRVKDAIHADLPRTRQVRPRRAQLRVPTMMSNASVAVRWGAVAAAIAVAVVLGAAFMTNNNQGTIAGPATPSPTPAPTPTRTPSPTPIANLLQAAEQVPCSDSPGAELCVKPGTYNLGPGMPHDILMTVPPGWWEWDYGGQSVGLLVEVDAPRHGSGWGFQINQVGEVSRDPCNAAAGSVPAAQVDTVDELVAAMSAWPGFEVTAPEAMSIDGIGAQKVTVRSTRTEGTCLGGAMWWTPSGTAIPPYPMVVNESGSFTDYPGEYRIFELDGQLVALMTTASARTSPFERYGGVAEDADRHAADLVALESIIDSIRFSGAQP